MIAPPHEFDLPCRFMIGGLANEQMLGWPVAPNAAALLRRIHLRKELLHTCEHESIEGTFRHCIASASARRPVSVIRTRANSTIRWDVDITAQTCALMPTALSRMRFIAFAHSSAVFVSSNTNVNAGDDSA